MTPMSPFARPQLEPPAAPLAVPVPVAAAMLSVSTRLVWTLIGRGELRAVKLGRRTVVPVADLEGLLGLDG